MRTILGKGKVTMDYMSKLYCPWFLSANKVKFLDIAYPQEEFILKSFFLGLTHKRMSRTLNQKVIEAIDYIKDKKLPRTKLADEGNTIYAIQYAMELHLAIDSQKWIGNKNCPHIQNQRGIQRKRKELSRNGKQSKRWSINMTRARNDAE